jgi:hypothetical protein
MSEHDRYLQDFRLVETTAAMVTGREHKYLVRLDLGGYGLIGEVQFVSDEPGDLRQKIYNFDHEFGTDFYKRFMAVKYNKDGEKE